MKLERFITPSIPDRWSRAWLVGWAVVMAGLVICAFLLPWGAFIPAFLLLFGVPEFIAVARPKDAYPPLTHVMRHFLKGWLAFPLLYGLLGSFGAKALSFGRWWQFGLLVGVLGWITHHFMLTYLGPDPFPGRDDSPHGE